MQSPEIRRALQELEETAHGHDGLQLVRWVASPWVVRWALGRLPEMEIAAAELMKAPSTLWTSLVPVDRDRLRMQLSTIRDAAVLEYRIERNGVLHHVRESVRRVDPKAGEAAFVSLVRDLGVGGRSDSGAVSAARLPPVVEGGPLVLVVEDDPHVRMIICRILKRRGYGALPAASVADALRLFERTPQPVPLLVADVILPDRSGPELARLLKRRDPDLRTIFVSGYSTEELRLRVRLPPDAPFLAKPFRPGDLGDAVDRAMARVGGGGAIQGPRSAV